VHPKFRTERLKGKIVNNNFQKIKKKLSRNRQNAIMFYGEGTFDSTGPSEHGGRSTGSMKRAYKRHFLTRPANVHRTLRSCIHCKEQDVTKEGDHAFCNRCESLTNTRQYMHKDKLGAKKIPRSGISDSRGRERPLDLSVPPSKR
jgi:hypothetical protein